MPKQKAKPVTVRGTVTAERVKRGTGSEHMGVVLRTARGESYLLQRIGGNPFDDPPTRELIGHRVVVAGFPIDGVFRYLSATIED